MSTNGSVTQQEQYSDAYRTPQASNEGNAESAPGNDHLPMEEVGWYFVEQYYNTLSKSPEKLHLFYNKKSQFVSGNEAEVTQVAVGRAQIQERIAALDFEDCKVRVTNVDSQSSFENIVIQVIGETSVKGGEPRKFAQTFVLAKQPNGYFVLNDIFRYIEEDGEEVDVAAQEEQTSAATQAEDVEMPKHQVAPEQPSPALDADVVDKKLETVQATSPKEEAEAPLANGEDAAPVETEEAPVTENVPEAEEEVPAPDVVEKAVEEEVKEAEKPAEPAPTPALTRLPSQTKPAAPAQPAAPPKPLTWASRAAAAAGPPKPAVPVVAPKVATPPTQARAPPSSTPSKPAQSQPTPAVSAEEKNKENEPGTPGGWQSVSNDHAKRQNKPQSISGPPEKEGTMGYVRNVSDKVQEPALREALGGFGNLIYFDINRSKNCAFVEYSSPEGYLAAAAANPHKIGGEEIYVEPRRPKASAYGGNSYSGPRGGINNRGRGNFEQGRPGAQGGRGNFGQNRGRGGAPRGRGTIQATGP